MKNAFRLSMLVALLLASGCSVIGGVFKAGFATAIIVVLVVVLLIVWLMSVFKGRS